MLLINLLVRNDHWSLTNQTEENPISRRNLPPRASFFMVNIFETQSHMSVNHSGERGINMVIRPEDIPDIKNPRPLPLVVGRKCAGNSSKLQENYVSLVVCIF